MSPRAKSTESNVQLRSVTWITGQRALSDFLDDIKLADDTGVADRPDGSAAMQRRSGTS